MKGGKLLLSIAITAILFSSCKREETLSYICTCKAQLGGATETHLLNKDSEEDAKALCESFAKPVTEQRYTCTLN